MWLDVGMKERLLEQAINTLFLYPCSFLFFSSALVLFAHTIMSRGKAIMATMLHCIVISAAALWVWWTLIPGNVVLIGGRTKFSRTAINIPNEQQFHKTLKVYLFFLLTIRHRSLGIGAHGPAIQLPFIVQHLFRALSAHKIIIRY